MKLSKIAQIYTNSVPKWNSRLIALATMVLVSGGLMIGTAKAQTATDTTAAEAPATNFLVATNIDQYKEQKVGDGYGPDLVKIAIAELTGRPTKEWRAGLLFTPENVATVPAGTAIASFADNGEYTNTAGESQAALFVGPKVVGGKTVGIVVLDQWPGQGMVKQRVIYFDNARKRNNNAFHFSSIRLATVIMQ